MNVFEDLIGALKEEDLLEETVIETGKNKHNDAFQLASVGESELTGDFAAVSLAGNSINDSKSETPVPQLLSIADEYEEITSLADFSIGKNAAKDLEPEIIVSSETDLPETAFQENVRVVDEKEFYRKRAMEEVSGLQMVEHVLSGVEREQNKAVAQVYDDIAVKKALHDLLQVSEDVKSPEHAQAEFRLMQETETWCSALSHRDKRISVGHLRRFCETTKPPLSSQALISLARFYRNLPYSESVRGKFDLVVTRLFAKDTGGEKRVMIFTREELISHFAELYAEWSSIPLYSTDNDETKIVETALKFEEFIVEAERAESFDELVNNDFFNRFRFFKESTDEVFFAPSITALNIEGNIRIGNKYVDLIDTERKKSNTNNLQEKYGFLNEQAISDSTSKTLRLVGLLKEKADEEDAPKIREVTRTPKPEKPAPAVKETKTTQKQSQPARNAGIKKEKPKEKTKENTKSEPASLNKWLLAAVAVVVLLGFGLYWQSNSGTDSGKAKKVNLENSSLKTYVQSAQIKDNTFYGVTASSWDTLTLEKREELLKKIFSSGADKGYVKVRLLNIEGKEVGFASAEKVEVITR